MVAPKSRRSFSLLGNCSFDKDMSDALENLGRVIRLIRLIEEIDAYAKKGPVPTASES
jgi:hypothetical protein